MQNITLRPMTKADIPQVYQLECHCHISPWTEGIFNDCLRVGYDNWVAVENEQIIGYAMMSVGAGESHILNLGVDPNKRKHGIATQLLNHLLKLAKTQHTEFAFLEVRKSNLAALHIYQKLGFNEIGIRKGYYETYSDSGRKGREDAIVLALDLSLLVN